MMRDNIDLSRGVDLAAIRDKAKHQHHWMIVARHGVTDKYMADLAQNKLVHQNGGEVKPLPLPLSNETLIALDGPGCVKCAFHWEAPATIVSGFGETGGYGFLCQVSDDVFEAQTGQKLPVAEEVVPMGDLLDPLEGGDTSEDEAA